MSMMYVYGQHVHTPTGGNFSWKKMTEEPLSQTEAGLNWLCD